METSNWDYYFDILTEPIEIEAEALDGKAVQPFPDLYRSHFFGMPNLIITEDKIAMSGNTFTKTKYWNTDYSNLVNKLSLLIDKFWELPQHSLAKLLHDNTIIPTDINLYYKKVYDYADILISTNGVLTTCIKILLDKIPKDNKNTILFRITIYLSIHFIRKSIEKPCGLVITSFITSMQAKLLEFENEANIDNYFTLIELQTYQQYISKLATQYKTMLDLGEKNNLS